MFCQNCGAEIEKNAKSCRSCGLLLTMDSEYISHSYVVEGREKSVGGGILLAFFLLGTGHLYAGKITRGLLIMLGFIGIILATIIVVAYVTELGYLIPIGGIALWIWSIYDAKKFLDSYNAGLRRFGTPPW